MWISAPTTSPGGLRARGREIGWGEWTGIDPVIQTLDALPEQLGREDYERQLAAGAGLRADDGARRIAWGAEGSQYEGWMTVDADGEGSKVTLHLTTPHSIDVDEYVEQTFDSLRRLV